MIIKTLAVGPIMANCFIVGCEQTREAAVIDPGDEADRILRASGRGPVDRHADPQHARALRPRRRQQAHEEGHRCADPDPRPGRPHAAHALPQRRGLGHVGRRLPGPGPHHRRGRRHFRRHDHVQGDPHPRAHSRRGLAVRGRRLFVGDTLFAGSVGRTDFPGGDFETLKSSIQKKLFALADDVKVFTGHGPETTIGEEKRHNPFVGMGARN